MRVLHVAMLVATMVASASDARAATALLTWDPAGPGEMVTGWKIYYDRDQAGAPYDGMEAEQGASPIDLPIAMVADVSTPTFLITGLESCVSYWFAVTAYNDAGESDFSGEVEKKVVAAPADLTAVSNAPGEVTLTWVAPPPGDPGVIPNFQVYYDLDGPGEPYSGAGSPFGIPAMNDVVISNLTTNATYWFVVDSVCDNFASKRSEEVSVQVISEFPDPPDMGMPVVQPPVMTDPDMGGSEEEPALEAKDSGCGCGVASGGDASGFFVLLALAFARRRRRATS